MDLTYKQEVTVGALVLVGFLVFTAFMFWLTGRSIVSKAVPVQVEFANVQGLKEGDPVRVSGVKKGRVGPVRLERVGRVTVTLQLDPQVQAHKDATATVAAADFLGAKYVDYNPGINDTLSVNLTQLTGRLADATGSLKGLLDKMDKGEGTLGKIATDTLLYRNLNNTLTSLTSLLNDLRERPGRYLTVNVF